MLIFTSTKAIHFYSFSSSHIFTFSRPLQHPTVCYISLGSLVDRSATTTKTQEQKQKKKSKTNTKEKKGF
jgi:hypothetical protein